MFPLAFVAGSFFNFIYLVGNPEDRFSHGVAQIYKEGPKVSPTEIVMQIYQIKVKSVTRIQWPVSQNSYART